MYDAGQHLNGIGAVYTMCTHFCQHEVLTRAEWIMTSTGDAGPTFNRHWIGLILYSVDTPQKALSSIEWLMARDGDSGPVLKWHWVDVSCLLGITW